METRSKIALIIAAIGAGFVAIWEFLEMLTCPKVVDKGTILKKDEKLTLDIAKLKSDNSTVGNDWNKGKTSL
jgi:hypothetical protein